MNEYSGSEASSYSSKETKRNAHTLDRSRDTYRDTVLQGRSLLLLDHSLARRVHRQPSVLSLEAWMQLPTVCHSFDRALSGY